MDTDAARRLALPRVLRRVEMFSDVLICEGEECQVVQVKQAYWMHDDGSYCWAVYRADNPALSESACVADPRHHAYLSQRIETFRRLALAS